MCLTLVASLTLWMLAKFPSPQLYISVNTTLPSLKSNVKTNLSILYQESPDVFNSIPTSFLRHHRNFCWNSDSTQWCLPAVYLAGMPKCGSTELFRKLLWHPQLMSPTSKENHYWARSRIGKSRDHRAQAHESNFESFSHFLRRFRPGKVDENALLVDGTQSLLWDLSGWESRYPWADHPPYSNADLIHEVTPGAKILVILRDPIERLYSDYLYFSTSKQNNTAYSFGEDVKKEVARFRACLGFKDLRTCCYDSDNSPIVRLSLGIYICYIRDWKEKFQDNLMLVRLEDYSSAPTSELTRIFRFLGVSSPDQRMLEAFLASSKPANARHENDRSKGYILERTFKLLYDFYKPYNLQLSTYLGDSKFYMSALDGQHE